MSPHEDQLRAENQRRIDALRDHESWISPPANTATQDYAFDDGNQEDETTNLGSHLKL